ncbi:MAG: hypothetical protein ACLPY5_06335 [Candidatus Bathyarchaeia archaeon]
MTSSLPFVIEGTIQNYIEKKLGYRREALKIVGYLAKSNLSNIIASRKLQFEKYEFKFRKTQEFEGYEFWEFAQRASELRFYALQTPEGYVFIMSKIPTETFKWHLLPFFASLYPDLTRLYLSSDEIRFALTRLEEQIGQPLFYRSVVMKRLFGVKERFTDVHFSRRDRPVEEAFRTAAMRGSWIDYIQVSDADRKQIGLSVTRRGTASVRRGRFGLVYDSILAPMCAKGRQRYAFMDNRERQAIPRKVNPFIIRYDETLFDKPEVIGRLRQILESYKHCYYTVVHSGNPYLYMMITDTLDNSAFSIRTLRENTLMIVPQVRATADSLMRFYRFMSAEFREGTLDNPTESAVV